MVETKIFFAKDSRLRLNLEDVYIFLRNRRLRVAFVKIRHKNHPTNTKKDNVTLPQGRLSLA